MIAHRLLLIRALMAFDLAAWIASFALGLWFTYLQVSGVRILDEFLTMRVKITDVVLILGLLSVWHLVLRSFQLYESRRLSKRSNEAFAIVKATSLVSALMFVAARLFKIEVVNSRFTAVFWIASTLIMIVSRLCLRWWLEWLRRRGRNLRNVLMIGTNHRAITFARDIESKPELGYRIVGFVDSVWDGIAEFLKTGYQLVTDMEGLRAYLRQEVIDEVYISLPLRSQHKMASWVASMCAEQGIVFRQVPEIFDLELPRASAPTRNVSPFFPDHHSPLEGWQGVMKRLLDIVLSAVALVVSLPLVLIIAVAIKLTSPGPVFFFQERIGYNKRHFRIIKFRTMVLDAERKQTELECLNESSGPVFKIKNDPRITRIGRILRKTSLDELPQFINVLLGQMSMVGPRPLPIRDYNGFSEDWQRRRVSVRPGITCLWQINGRNKVAFKKWMELDLQYLDNWSLWLDLKIILKTIPSVLFGTGAY